MTPSRKLNSENDSEAVSQNSRLGRLGFVLRRHEQVTLFAILVICTLLMGGYFLQLHWKHGKLIDIDEIEFQATTYSVDLNHADWPEFANLPNIGEKLAKAIVKYRDENGGFEDVDQLKNVPGIGPAKLESMRDYLIPPTNKQPNRSLPNLDSP